ncbi:MAG TPA: FAD/NAD(P)-binding protein [Solirubrobacteraceae bacterium]|nr:FAD/NAD(P)-binding protein [Solirubrobacteraceae bacterium]
MAEPPAPYRVADTRRETGDTWTLRLEPPGGATPAAFEPGQFAMLYAFGVGEAPISVSATHDGALVHTVRAVGAVTRALCAARSGDVVGVRGPFGTRWPLARAEGRDVVVVAGGIGLPPLRAVIERLLADRGRYGEVNVLYGGRAPSELLYPGDVERWAARSDVRVHVTVDAPSAGWRGRVGVVTRLLDDAVFDPPRTTAMMCGPEVMMRVTAVALRDRGVAGDDIWLSLERNMACGEGHCGHCQLGPLLVCRDGPVVRHDVVEPLLRVAGL